MTKTTLEPIIQLGEAVEHRGVAIVPLFPRTRPQVDYLTLDEAIPLGFRVTEVDAAGSVPELLALNPLDSHVLLYDGEELLGAKQNRILNVSVLVPTRSETRIPVSCVEEGRWRARSAFFEAAPHAAYPDLRRAKAERLSAAPLERGIAQAAVWAEVGAKAGRHRVASPTGAADDIYRAREKTLATLRHAFPISRGQSGALFVGANGLCLDYVSRPDAFARLYPKLLEGYLLDAVEHLDQPCPDHDVERFLEDVMRAPRSRRASAGLGDDVRLRADGVIGSGLEFDGEMVQLCAFSTEGGAQRLTQISRPSRRRS